MSRAYIKVLKEKSFHSLFTVYINPVYTGDIPEQKQTQGIPQRHIKRPDAQYIPSISSLVN